MRGFTYTSLVYQQRGARGGNAGQPHRRRRGVYGANVSQPPFRRPRSQARLRAKPTPPWGAS